MESARRPGDEEARIAALRETAVLDTGRERSFDDLTALGAKLCGAPIALITLVDVDRQWFKSRQGLQVMETARDVAFCAHTILEPDLFVVSDALKDARFADNPLVAEEPEIRFYAGSPLATDDGHAIGTFCVIDRVPRELSEEMADALRTLARHTSSMLQLRRSRERSKASSREWEQAVRDGDVQARREALAGLARHLRAMLLERERAETTLHRLEEQLREVGMGNRCAPLARSLDEFMQVVIHGCDLLLSRIGAGDVSQDEAAAIQEVAMRATSFLSSVERMPDQGGSD